MATHHVYTRTEYTEPLAWLRDVESDTTPDLATAVDDPAAWLEVATIPADTVTWVIRDGDLVDTVDRRAAPDTVADERAPA